VCIPCLKKYLENRSKWGVGLKIGSCDSRDVERRGKVAGQGAAVERMGRIGGKVASHSATIGFKNLGGASPAKIQKREKMIRNKQQHVTIGYRGLSMESRTSSSGKGGEDKDGGKDKTGHHRRSREQ